MSKKLFFSALVAAQSAVAMAGGYLTNTNQSVVFLRNPARDATFGIEGCYTNPAGIGFMSKGWHFAFDVQSAYQTRCIDSWYADGPFRLGTVNGVANDPSGRKHFNGKAAAPVLPSFDLAKVSDRWFMSFHFGVTGGGGKCKFDDGLPSFEGQVAMLPALIGTIAPGVVNGYEIDTHMQGRQYYFGGQFGVGYKLLPGLSVSAGGRVVYADCNYYGYVRNISVSVNTPTGSMTMPAAQFFESQNMPHFAAVASDRELNCDQTGWGFTPIISVDYKTGRWNFAAKYEFKTRLRLKNRSGENTSGLDEFDDGKKVAADIPAILTMGAQYEIMKGLRASAGFHYYFDKQATQYENREEHLNGDGWEVLAGLEYDLNDKWTVSAGWQTTNYGLGNDSRFLRDLSFVTNSHSVGLGTAFRVSPKVRLNVAYFKTFYRHYRKNMADYADLKTTFGKMLKPMGNELETAAGQLQAIISNPNVSEADRIVAGQKLGIIQGELGALDAITNGMAGYSTAGFDNFHRTNDVFGIGVEINF